jgi:hypothetical protein
MHFFKIFYRRGVGWAYPNTFYRLGHRFPGSITRL